MTLEVNQPDITLDFRSLRCPNLLIAVIKEMESAQPGQVLRVEAADLNATSSISSWTRQSGHELLDMYEQDGDFIFLLLCQSGKVAELQSGKVKSPIRNLQSSDSGPTTKD